MNWYRQLDGTERATFQTAFGGWTLDAFDFMVMTLPETRGKDLAASDRKRVGADSDHKPTRSRS